MQAPTPAPTSAATRVPDACLPVRGPASEILRGLREELLAAVAKDAQEFQQSVQSRVSAFQDKHGTVLAEHATWSLRQMPKVTLPGLEAMPDDPRVAGEVAAQIRRILADEKDQDGLSFQSFMGLLSADPIRAFAGIRGFVMGAWGAPGDLKRMREDILEGFAPPRIVRVNDDVDHPVLAMPKRADIFVVWFDRDDRKGAFVPKRIRWVRRDPPAEPSLNIQTAEDALLAFAHAVESSQPEAEAGDTAANLSMRLLTQVNGLAETWLVPYAALLRRHGACVCNKLPQGPVPDLAGWKETEGMEKMSGLTPLFPRLRWDPVQSFLFLRTAILSRTLSVGDYAGVSLVDGLVPPDIARMGDDPDHPALFLVEGETALVVEFSSTPDRGYFPTSVRYLRRD
jgi:hypothetical protein